MTETDRDYLAEERRAEAHEMIGMLYCPICHEPRPEPYAPCPTCEWGEEDHTPLPWRVEFRRGKSGGVSWDIIGEESPGRTVLIASCETEEDARFIVQAVNP